MENCLWHVPQLNGLSLVFTLSSDVSTNLTEIHPSVQEKVDTHCFVFVGVLGLFFFYFSVCLLVFFFFFFFFF